MPAQQPLIDSLVFHDNPLFRGLNAQQLQELLTICEVRTVGPDTEVMLAGDVPDGLYLIAAGRVDICLGLADGSQTTLAELGAGQIFGELALIDNAPRSASAFTRSLTTLYRIDAAGFRRLRLQGRPAAYDLLRAVAPVICQRLRTINERIGSMLLHPERETANFSAVALLAAGFGREQSGSAFELP